jgi:hypothetical protein
MSAASRHIQFVRRGISRGLSIRRQRRLVGLLVLLGMLCTYLPLPAPPVALSPSGERGRISGGAKSQQGKDLSRPFPCAQRVCGCRSAEQCWRKCCCFSDAEKVAWADAHGVELPEFVRRSANRSTDIKHRAICRSEAAGTAGCARCDQSQPATSVAGNSDPTRVQPGAVRQRSGPRTELAPCCVVIVQDALGCQGIDWQWQFDPGTAPRPSALPAAVEPPPRYFVPSLPVALRNPSRQVPVPPPRRDWTGGSSA